MKIKEYTKKNRKAWNETMPFHKTARGQSLLDKFKDPNYSYLEDIEKTKLNEIGISNKIVAQVCCNNAVELISVLRLGAKKGYGFDIADEAIKQAREIADVARVNCEFVRTDVYNLPNKYYNKFDIIYISAGSINWLPDIKKFIETIGKMLKKEGILFMYDIHPFSEVFAQKDDSRFDPKKPYAVIDSYFGTSPKINMTGLDYLGKQKYKSNPNYWFTHKLSDIFNSCIKNNIQILEFNEYSRDISAVFGHLEKDDLIPLSFILIGKKISEAGKRRRGK